MSLSILDYVLWFTTPAIQVAILVFMGKRGLRQHFPNFFNYNAYQIAVVALMVLVYHVWPWQYFYAYWATAAVSIFLGFLVIHEVFAYVIRPYPGLRDLAGMIFRWAVFLLVLVTGLFAASASTVNSDVVVRTVINLERAVRLVQCGLLLFVVMTSNYLGLSWRNFACGISFGFGLFAATDLVLYNLRASIGADWNRALGLISVIAYGLSVLIWFAYARMPQAVMVRNEVIYRPLFDRWNQAALLLVNKQSGSSDSYMYLSEIEQTVDSVMAQSKKVEKAS
ncbi:MAG: hypothetical protein HYX26_04335 [Acidobacteriales bacterium]|nr:hypothetical protein [Terriglobales bacterium]